MNVWQNSRQERTRERDQDPTAEPARRLSILVIDDNFEYADTLRYLLEYCGHSADVAVDGPSGVRLALSGSYSAIICDIGLPGLNGYEVAKRLRSEAATAGIRMIAVTAYGSAEAKRQCFAAGFDAHLLKPASVTDVLAQLGIRSPDILA